MEENSTKGGNGDSCSSTKPDSGCKLKHSCGKITTADAE